MSSQSNRQNPRGQGMVEFALALPIILMVIFGIIEFGRLLLSYSAVFSASREAARYGAAVGDNGGGT
ncbi:MAG TPA: TadE family protein, partial [Anaerolineaceae bacterium]|nr:TadE family protein [Anaerolineaceae bacterium]